MLNLARGISLGRCPPNVSSTGPGVTGAPLPEPGEAVGSAVRAAGAAASSRTCGPEAGSVLGAGISLSIVMVSSMLAMPRGFSGALGYQVSSPNRHVVSASLPENWISSSSTSASVKSGLSTLR